MVIKSPYNFVPLNSDVFIPEWNDLVSQDIPFKDGEDGIIRFTITNLTQMHISQGKKNDAGHISVSCHIDEEGGKRYFIPATSIKGMIRSVAEILSFSKLNIYNDDYFGYRIFMNPKSDDYKRYHKEMEDPYCGFLVKDNDDYLICSCGKPERIDKKDIKSQELYKSEGYTLVKSGPMNSKKHEHLFGPTNGEVLPVPQEVIKVFLSVYKPNKEFENKYKALKKGQKLPVFYHLDKDGRVKHLGLSRNYRLPYHNNVSRAIRQNCKDIKGKPAVGHDMVETLFGYAEKDSALKGRVQVSHAFCKEYLPEESLETISGVMGQPQASFTPLYLQQNVQGKYLSYNDNNVAIAGRKRYRIHRDDYITKMPGGNDNEKVMTRLQLLPAGNSFDVAIRVHNLKPCEIGLILSALTFHNTKSAYHNIGMGKSFGYGKLDVSDIKFEGLCNQGTDHYLREFEKVLCKFTLKTQSQEWSKTTQVKSLVAIASNHDKDLDLMVLNEYKAAKQEKNYSRLSEPTIDVVGLVSHEYFEAEEIEKKKREIEEEERKEREQKAMKERAAALIREAETLLKQGDPNGAKVKCEEAKAVNPDVALGDLEGRIETAIKKGNETIQDFAESLNIASIGAFEGHCKKRIKAGHPFVMEDVDILAAKIKPNIPKGNKKEWADKKRWQGLAKTLGQDVADALYAKVNG